MYGFVFIASAMATSSVVGSRCGNKVGGLTPLAVKMASRNQEIRPVGAWVEPATQYDCNAVVSDDVWVVGSQTIGIVLLFTIAMEHSGTYSLYLG